MIVNSWVHECKINIFLHIFFFHSIFFFMMITLFFYKKNRLYIYLCSPIFMGVFNRVPIIPREMSLLSLAQRLMVNKVGIFLIGCPMDSQLKISQSYNLYIDLYHWWFSSYIHYSNGGTQSSPLCRETWASRTGQWKISQIWEFMYLIY